jgi:hypothetical protein
MVVVVVVMVVEKITNIIGIRRRRITKTPKIIL